MTIQCKVCTHPNRDAIDRALYDKLVYKDILLEYPEFSKASLSRHRNNHLVIQDAQVPTISKSDIESYGKPDILAIVEGKVARFEILQLKRALTPREETKYIQYIELLAKLGSITKDAPPDEMYEIIEGYERKISGLTAEFNDKVKCLEEIISELRAQLAAVTAVSQSSETEEQEEPAAL